MLNSGIPQFAFQGLSDPWQAYLIYVEPECKSASTDKEATSIQAERSGNKKVIGLIRFITPWSSDATHAFIGNNNTNR